MITKQQVRNFKKCKETSKLTDRNFFTFERNVHLAQNLSSSLIIHYVLMKILLLFVRMSRNIRVPAARQKNVLSQSAYLFTLSNYQSNHAKDNRK